MLVVTVIRSEAAAQTKGVGNEDGSGLVVTVVAVTSIVVPLWVYYNKFPKYLIFYLLEGDYPKP